MPTRREFLRHTALGAVALALVGCSDEPESESLEGLQPIKYGDAPSQLAELLLPNDFGPFPLVVIIHGGWWRSGWDRRGTRELARDLARHGYATWNLEYRLVGEEGGGWPGTFEDVATGIDLLADRAPEYNVDLERVAFLGHSAGGHLALWAAARNQFFEGTIGDRPRVTPRTVVAVAPVTDLATAAWWQMGEGAVQALTGGEPDAVPLVYQATSPVELVPIEVPQALYHAVGDTVVPVEQSRIFAEKSAGAGSSVQLVEFADGDHFDAIDVDHEHWAQIRDRMGEYVSGQIDDTAREA